VAYALFADPEAGTISLILFGHVIGDRVQRRGAGDPGFLTMYTPGTINKYPT